MTRRSSCTYLSLYIPTSIQRKTLSLTSLHSVLPGVHSFQTNTNHQSLINYVFIRNHSLLISDECLFSPPLLGEAQVRACIVTRRGGFTKPGFVVLKVHNLCFWDSIRWGDCCMERVGCWLGGTDCRDVSIFTLTRRLKHARCTTIRREAKTRCGGDGRVYRRLECCSRPATVSYGFQTEGNENNNNPLLKCHDTNTALTGVVQSKTRTISIVIMLTFGQQRVHGIDDENRDERVRIASDWTCWKSRMWAQWGERRGGK